MSTPPGPVCCSPSVEQSCRTSPAATGLVIPDEVVNALASGKRTPADLSAALAADVEARQFFDALAYSRRKEWVRWIEEAKRAETRSTRIAKAVESRRAGQRSH